MALNFRWVDVRGGPDSNQILHEFDRLGGGYFLQAAGGNIDTEIPEVARPKGGGGSDGDESAPDIDRQDVDFLLSCGAQISG